MRRAAAPSGPRSSRSRGPRASARRSSPVKAPAARGGRPARRRRRRGRPARRRRRRDGVADRREADERRAQDHAVTPATRVRAPIVRASSPASAGRRVHLPVARNDDRSHRAQSCQREPLDAVEGPLDRRAMDRPGAPASSVSVASGVSRRAARDGSGPSAILGEPAVVGERAMASSCRPAAATVRARFADSALMTRLSSPRSARATCRASSSSRLAPRPSAAGTGRRARRSST